MGPGQIEKMRQLEKRVERLEALLDEIRPQDKQARDACDHCSDGWRFIPEADSFVPCRYCNPLGVVGVKPRTIYGCPSSDPEG